MSRRRGKRPVRLLTSLAWMAGSALLLMAAATPLVYDGIYVSSFRGSMTDAVSRVVELERNELVLRERFQTFGEADAALPAFIEAGSPDAVLFNDPRFRLDGLRAPDGTFVVRATTRAAAVRSRYLPVLVYEQRMDASGDVQTRKWIDG